MINDFQTSGDPSLCTHRMTGVSSKKPFSKDPYELLESHSHRCPQQTVQACAFLMQHLPSPIPTAAGMQKVPTQQGGEAQAARFSLAT